MPPLFDRLVPILFVRDLEAERHFYVSLGFAVTYEGSEFPGFLALGHGPIEFGLERKEGFDQASADQVLTWQFGVTDLELARERLIEIGVPYNEEWITPTEDWRYRVLHARTPNGYHLMLEGDREESEESDG